MARRPIRFGIIGCGMMGREFASAAARWCHLLDLDFYPVVVGVCDANRAATDWFQVNVPTVTQVTTDYRELITNPAIEAVYCAVPHNLHAQMYVDIISAGKHLLGEKPFGIDLGANLRILEAVRAHSAVLVRASSEFPFYPGAYRLAQLVRDNAFGQIIEVEAGFWHSGDLNPTKPMNWKRQVAANGEYGCMGDLGLHVLHIPLRYGWMPANVRALLSNIVRERPDRHGSPVACETWDNALLACEVQTADQTFPMLLSTKRIAPGHTNTWFIRILGTRLSAEFSTRQPKQLVTMPYQPGGEQAWRSTDLGYESAYPSITGGIFEFGFPDAILQMWASFCDELVHGEAARQPFHCVTPTETNQSHLLFTAALESQRTGQTINL